MVNAPKPLGSSDTCRPSTVRRVAGCLARCGLFASLSSSAEADDYCNMPYALLINPNGTWSIWASTPVSYGNGSFAAGNWTNEVLLSSSSSRAPIIGTSISYPEFALVSLGPWSLALSDAGQPRLVSANGSVAWEASIAATAPSIASASSQPGPSLALASIPTNAPSIPTATVTTSPIPETETA
ncbi:hypothetical protein HYH03_010060 [Edaphochlamys debaryana]|uniref:Uncharacterized protein n=1 Tax=Edaphochlamys debaryana TaxID=47281 RepID=A0A835XXZ5_9CHLO|nr:hypothetical protein HYH03_010060 [Edaphochlamys debaryana]|eukprot:KAG2491692.1 hypothetical protein HYH03_010060 [Edaphochlamys debaryana]